MKILITGKNGQLGQELLSSIPDNYSCYACDLPEVDISIYDVLESVITGFQPDILINAAAYTAVDKAESEKDLAYKVNKDGIRNIVSIIKGSKTRLIHLSTDFVFSGNRNTPYPPESEIHPINTYGRSKAEGEEIILHSYPENSIILRTSWLYSSHGNNFVKTMLTLMREERPIKVVTDQTGSPTWTKGLANTIWEFCNFDHITGIYHWTDSGEISWYDFAVAIQEEALQLGLLTNKVDIFPVTTKDYPTPARRPPYSVLDKRSTWDIIGFQSPHWRVSLREMLTELKNNI